MGLELGSIVDGKITGITKFGAFAALPDGKSGLVHISEIANSYVSDVHDFLQIGQEVKVKVLSIGDDGKINLSIKKALETETRPAQCHSQPQPRPEHREPRRPVPVENERSGDNQFEERLKKFMQESDSRIADNPVYADHKKRSRRR